MGGTVPARHDGKGAVRRRWRGCGAGRGQLAGLPEVEQIFEPGEQAGEGGENQGVQSRDHPGLRGALVGFGTDGGGDGASLCGQGG